MRHPYVTPGLMGSRTTALLWKRLSFHPSHCFRVTTTVEFASVLLLKGGPFDPKLATKLFAACIIKQLQLVLSFWVHKKK